MFGDSEKKRRQEREKQDLREAMAYAEEQYKKDPNPINKAALEAVKKERYI